MAFTEGARKLDSVALGGEYLAIEARIAAAEQQVEALEIEKYASKSKSGTPFASLDNRVDKDHIQIMDALHRLEAEMKSQITERLARVESKLQNVA